MTEQDIIDLISNDPWMMEVLRTAESLHLQQWMIGAGFIRNKIWNELSGFPDREHSTDIDLVYFDHTNVQPEIDWQYDIDLKEKMNIKWSVKNQARMHLVTNVSPYSSTENAIEHWPETATAIGVTLENEKVKLFIPYGINDLINMFIRPTPKFERGFEGVKERIEKKGWLEQWPNLKIEN